MSFIEDHLNADLIDPKKFHEVIKAEGLLSLKSDFHKKNIEEMFVDEQTPLVRTYHPVLNALAVHALISENADVTVWTKIVDFMEVNLNGKVSEVLQYILPILYILIFKFWEKCKCQRQNRPPRQRPFQELQRLLTKTEPAVAPVY